LWGPRRKHGALGMGGPRCPLALSVGPPPSRKGCAKKPPPLWGAPPEDFTSFRQIAALFPTPGAEPHFPGQTHKVRPGAELGPFPGLLVVANLQIPGLQFSNPQGPSAPVIPKAQIAITGPSIFNNHRCWQQRQPLMFGPVLQFFFIYLVTGLNGGKWVTFPPEWTRLGSTKGLNKFGSMMSHPSRVCSSSHSWFQSPRTSQTITQFWKHHPGVNQLSQSALEGPNWEPKNGQSTLGTGICFEICFPLREFQSGTK